MPDSAFAQWLQSPERLTSIEDPVLVSRWGGLAAVATSSSALAQEADANAEAARQLAFKGGPLVEENVIVPKLLSIAAHRGKVFTVKVPGDATYAAGVEVFILGLAPDEATGVTLLTVLRRMT